MKIRTRNTSTSRSVHRLFQSIPESKRNAVLKQCRSKMLSPNTVRTQAYFAKELYVVLDYFGAFESGESMFITKLAERYLEDKIVADRVTSLLQDKA